jgi:hypothetical protein
MVVPKTADRQMQISEFICVEFCMLQGHNDTQIMLKITFRSPRLQPVSCNCRVSYHLWPIAGRIMCEAKWFVTTLSTEHLAQRLQKCIAFWLWRLTADSILILRKEHRLQVFENRVLRRIFGPERV